MLFLRCLAIFCLLATNALVAAQISSSHMAFPKISAHDFAGKSLPGAKAAVRKEKEVEYFIDGWYKADPAGVIQIDINKAKGHWNTAVAEGTYRVMIYHDGYAPATLFLDIPSTSSEVNVIMQPGKLVKFKVTSYGNTSLPDDLMPVVIDTRVSTAVIHSLAPWSEFNQLNEPPRMFSIEKAGDGEFTTRVPEDLNYPLRFAINYPGYMANYLSPEFMPEEVLKSRVDLKLPVPGSIKVHIEPESTTATDTFKLSNVTVRFWRDGSLLVSTTASQVIDTELRGLVPGKYMVGITAPLVQGEDLSRVFPAFNKPSMQIVSDSALVTSGGRAEVQQKYPLLPKDFADGDGSIRVQLESSTGQKLAGMPYRLLIDTDTYFRVPVREGVVTKDNVIKMSGLRREGIRYYQLEVGIVSNTIITFADDTHVSVTRYIPPAKGDTAPELDAFDIETSAPLSLEALHGKVIILEFWASWCGPCQDKMQNLSDISKMLPDDLKDKVALVTVSVDDGPEEAKKHLEKKGWVNPNLQHYWYGPGTPSARGGPYGVSSIPHAVIIGKDGKIAQPSFSVDDELVQTLKNLVPDP